MKKISVYLIISILAISIQRVSGQLHTERDLPISFLANVNLQTISKISMPVVDTRSLLREDDISLRRSNADDISKPFRFGYMMDVDINLKRVGTRVELENGDKLWLLKIHCPDAYSINLIYNNFRLSEGSKFFIYNEDKTMILETITPEISNNQDNRFATDLVQGNTVILEYYEPQASNDGVINIGNIVHGYIDVFNGGLGSSANCNIDVMCQNNWRDEIRSVVRIVIGDRVATGVLLNNTQHNMRPFILTARHSVFESNTSNTLYRPLSTAVFSFLYWKPECNSGTPLGNYSRTGAFLRADWAPTDFALLELSQRPDPSWNLFYAGWDRSARHAQSSVGIHHPNGDAMKISQSQIPVVPFAWVGGVHNYWRATFAQGIIQSGSSGSPLFNQDKRVVGQLRGFFDNRCDLNDNDCFCQRVRQGDYGRFDFSWVGLGGNASGLRDWLAPSMANNAPETLDGTYAPRISGTPTVEVGQNANFFFI
jgi:hypothetical protein